MIRYIQEQKESPEIKELLVDEWKEESSIKEQEKIAAFAKKREWFQEN